MSKYEIDVWEYADEFKNLDTNETFGGYAVCELLEQKDQQIAELQKQLEEKEKLLQYGKTEIKKLHKRINDIVKRDEKLFKSQPAEIVEKIREWGQKHYNWVGDGTGYDGQDYNECIGFNKAIDQLNEILDTILKEYQK